MSGQIAQVNRAAGNFVGDSYVARETIKSKGDIMVDGTLYVDTISERTTGAGVTINSDPIVGAWNLSIPGFNAVYCFNQGGTSILQSDVDIGTPNPDAPAPPGYRFTISTGNWKRIGANRYSAVDSNVRVEQDLTYGNASVATFRIKKTYDITLVKVGGEDQLEGTVIFSVHALSDTSCVTPLLPPSPPLPATLQRLKYELL